MTPAEIIEGLGKYLSKQRFVKLAQNSKVAIEKGWREDANYQYYDSEFKEFLDAGHNYSILCGEEGLLVIDLDTPDAMSLFKDNPVFCETFATKSALKGYHHYYFRLIDKENGMNFYIDTDAKDSNGNCVRYLDGQYLGKLIVGFGSKIDGKEYTIVQDKPVKLIMFEDLMVELSKAPYPVKGGREKESPSKPFLDNPELAEIRKRIKVYDVLKESGVSVRKNNSKSGCPFHDSQSDQCFNRTDDQWHCFHCERSGDIFSLYQEVHKITFPEAVRALKISAGLSRPAQLPSKLNSDEIEAIYYELDLESLVVHKNHDETQYEFKFNDCSIWLSPDDILTPNSFRKKYVNERMHLLPSLSMHKWQLLFNHWLQEKRKVIDNSEHFNSQTTNLDNILDYIRNSRGVIDPEVSLNMNKFLYREKTPDYIYLAHESINSMLLSKRLNMTLAKFKNLLGKYIVDAVPVNCGGQSKRFTIMDARRIPGFNMNQLEELREQIIEDKENVN